MMQKYKLSSLLQRNASKTISAKPTAQEYDLLILSFKVLRIAAAVVSILSGFCFFYYKVFYLIDTPAATPIAATASAALLIGIEIAVAYSLTKSFKFAFKHDFKQASGNAIISIIFFSISFVVSTQGIAAYKQDNATDIQAIEKKFEELTTAINNDFTRQIKEVNNALMDIKPYAWNKDNLTTEQQQKKFDLRQLMTDLEKQKRDSVVSVLNLKKIEINAQQQATNRAAEDYYIFVAVILCCSLLFNGLIVYFDTLIFRETEEETAARESVNIVMKEVKADIEKDVRESVTRLANYYSAAFTHTLNADTVKNEPHQVQAPPQAAPQPRRAAYSPRVTGFTAPDTKTNTDQSENSSTSQNIPGSIPQNNSLLNDAAICPVCGKNFKPINNLQVYCSEACRFQNWANRHRKPFSRNGITYYPN